MPSYTPQKFRFFELLAVFLIWYMARQREGIKLKPRLGINPTYQQGNTVVGICKKN